jgi:hypothetical protein
MLQIDVLSRHSEPVPYVLCNLFTDKRVVKISMLEDDYRSLQRDGFFLRHRDQADGAGVINTSRDYYPAGESHAEDLMDSTQEFTEGLD